MAATEEMIDEFTNASDKQRKKRQRQAENVGRGVANAASMSSGNRGNRGKRATLTRPTAVRWPINAPIQYIIDVNQSEFLNGVHS